MRKRGVKVKEKCIEVMVEKAKNIKIKEITDEEYEKMKKKLENKKAPDEEGWRYEWILNAGKEMEEGRLQQNVKNSGFCNFGSPQKNFIPRMCFKHGSTLRKHVQKQKFENIDQELSIAVTYGTYCVTYGTVLS